MTPEEKRLRKICRQWERLYDWDLMAKHYHPNVAQVNLGSRPKIPDKIK